MSFDSLTERSGASRAFVAPARSNGAGVEELLQKGEAMLRVTSVAASRLAAVPWTLALPEVLAELGAALDVSRIWVVAMPKNQAPRQLALWSAPAETDGEPLDWSSPAWRSLAGTGQPLRLKKAALSEDFAAESAASAAIENEFLELRGAFSLAAAPIRIAGDEENWGFIGVEAVREARQWDELDVSALRLVAELLGGAIAHENFAAALRQSEAQWRQSESERRESEAELRESEAELRALFRAMNDVVFVVDREGRYLKIITNELPLLFQPASQMLGRTLDEVLGEGIGGEFVGVVRDVLDTQSLRSLEYPLEIGGETAWFSAMVTPLSKDTALWVARDITPARRARESLRQSEALFRLLAENSTDKIARLSLDGRFLYVSPSVMPLLGYTPEELIGVSPFEMVHPEDWATVLISLDRIQKTPGSTDTIPYRIRQRAGRYIWFETSSRLVTGENGQAPEIHSVSRDISERRNAEAALRDAEAKYRSIFENAVEGIFRSTPAGRYLDANPSLARIYGYDSPAQLRQQLADISRQLYLNPRRRLDFAAEMEKNGAVANFESQIRRKDGEIIWISENARSVHDAEGQLQYYEGTVEDITARKNAEGQLLHDALHDKLTGLSNRALFMDRLSQAFSRLKRHPEAVFAALFLDFDRFKNVNDSLGHMAGDQLLIEVSRRIAECLRPGDTISRLGGDEFAILLEDVPEVAGAILVAERIQEAMAGAFRIAGQEVFTSASIGIAMGHGNYNHPEEILRDADMAMYRAKALGKARHHVFDAGMHRRAVALLQLETDLRHAIERDEFLVVYQPIIALASGQITGFEALIRWQHPQRGMISPGEFIPVAEETGWIVPIGRWVLEEASRQLAQWHAQTGDTALSMSVNLSSKQFAQPDLLLEIQEVLERYKLPAATLKLEITESALMERAQEITDRLLALRTLGIKLGLDDFGTGYSSLSYLHRFPLDTLKIDRSFITRMGAGGSEGGENREIVRTIVSLGANLGMNVVAEGIENAQQLADLRALNCQGGQGYFFARPLAPEDALKLLKRAPRW